MDGVGLDNTLDLDNNPATAGDPCSSKTLDVKATDDDAPLLFGFLPFVADPKKKARVEILQVKEQNGMLPWAVPDIEPAAVAAIFVDENDGVVKTPPQPLCNVTAVSCAGLPTPDSKLSYWVTPAFEDLVDIVGENTGVVILVSKIDDTPMLTTGAGALTAMCTQSPGLVSCYGDGNQDGLRSSMAGLSFPAEPRSSHRFETSGSSTSRVGTTFRHRTSSEPGTATWAPRPLSTSASAAIRVGGLRREVSRLR